MPQHSTPQVTGPAEVWDGLFTELSQGFSATAKMGICCRYCCGCGCRYACAALDPVLSSSCLCTAPRGRPCRRPQSLSSLQRQPSPALSSMHACTPAMPVPPRPGSKQRSTPPPQAGSRASGARSCTRSGFPRPGCAGAQAPPDPAAAAELEQLAAAYGLVADPRTRFSHLFLNVVEHPGQRVRPPNVDALQWRQALHAAGGEGNPRHLWPVLAVGFKDLVARKQAQVCPALARCAALGLEGGGGMLQVAARLWGSSLPQEVWSWRSPASGRHQAVSCKGRLQGDRGCTGRQVCAEGCCEDWCWPSGQHAVSASASGKELRGFVLQDAAIQEHEQRLAGVQQAVAELQRRQDALLQISLDKVSVDQHL